MYRISEQQIDRILDDISARGVELESLQLNLLDHICCIIERELEENGDFEQFYAATIKRFYKAQLSEIEEETISLLQNKNYYAMKKVMIASGVFSAVVFAMGLILKFMHAPGASAGITLGILTLSLVFLPLVFLLKSREQKAGRDKLLAGLGTLSACLMSLSVLFAVQHWPGTINLGYATVGILVLLFLPVYIVTGIRNPESKVNTIVTSVLIVGGCGLWLTLVSSPRAEQRSMVRNATRFERNEQILEHERALLSARGAHLSKEAMRIDQLSEQIKLQILKGAKLYDPGNGKEGGSLRDGWFMANISETTEQQIQELKGAVAMYNKANAKGGAEVVPTTSNILDGSEERVSGAIASLVQIQMYVLQNEQQTQAGSVAGL